LFTSATTNKDDLTKNVFYPTTIGVQIPFIISPDTFSYSYYNPLVKYNFQPNDYLLNDITPVAKQVSSTNA
jgi:hypothetical protein